MRYRFIEARKRVGDIHGFLVPGDREEAAVEIRRLLRDWPGDLVELGGLRVPASTIDPVSIVIGDESEPRGTRSHGGPPRYAIDGTFIEGLEGA